MDDRRRLASQQCFGTICTMTNQGNILSINIPLYLRGATSEQQHHEQQDVEIL